MTARRPAQRALCVLVVLGALAVVAAPQVTAAASGHQPASSDTVWLCRPGQAGDPCTWSPASTMVSASGATTVGSALPAASSKFDCFYVYPTVSTQPGDNANLTVQKAEVTAAISQASRFSRVCRVWAPMYRQRTAGSLQKGLGADPAADPVSDVAREEAAYKA
jgi:hypothetical protein